MAMKLNDFRKIINQYLEGVSPLESRKKVESFLKRSYKRRPFKSTRLLNEREALKEELWGEIDHKIKGKAKARRSFLKIAAIVSLLIISSAILYKVSLPILDRQKIIVVKTNEGQRRTVTLADGSIVRMNANSSLSFPEKFAADIREIALTGEAFFEVEKDPSRPFVVTSGNIETTVLGTEFNIRAYRDADIDVTVTEGKVKVTRSEDPLPHATEGLVLIPGQQALFSIKDKSLTRQEVNVKHYIAWQEKELDFESTPFREVLKILERTYQTKIELTPGSSKEECLVKARFRNKDLESILKGLQRLLSFDYKYKDSKIIIHNKGCNTP